MGEPVNDRPDQQETLEKRKHMKNVSCQTIGTENYMVKHPFDRCTTTCMHDGKDPKSTKFEEVNWVRCALCVHWYHPGCVGLPQDETEGIWTCPSCRDIAHDTNAIKSTVNSLMKTVSTLEETVKTLVSIVTKDNFSITQLVADHKETLQVIQSLQLKSDEPAADLQKASMPKKSMLIGDSLIKHVQSKSDQLIVKANVPRIKDVIRELHDHEALDAVFIVNGTNDCKTKADPSEIVDDFKALIREAKTKANKVHLSSITPRTDNAEAMQKINTVNQMLVILANEEHINLVNNDENFTYRNNDVDVNLLQIDGCHLSHQGILRLMTNLNLQECIHSTLAPPKAPDSSRTSEPWSKVVSRKNKQFSNVKPEQKPFNDTTDVLPSTAPPAPIPPKLTRKITFKGHQHPLSNFFPCIVDLYDKQFCNAEAAYQYRKALEYSAWELAEEILDTSRAVDAKRLGDKLPTDQRWWDIRESIMMEVVSQKAKQCAEFRNTLTASEGNTLIEDTVHEFWGTGRQGNGLNKLGQLLMILRTNLPAPVIKSQNNYSPQNYSRNFYENDHEFQNLHEDIGCGFCGERGHNSEVCGHGRPIKCRNCNGYRHKEKVCWYRTY